jgi:hypothetical protein
VGVIDRAQDAVAADPGFLARLREPVQCGFPGTEVRNRVLDVQRGNAMPPDSKMGSPERLANVDVPVLGTRMARPWIRPWRRS